MDGGRSTTPGRLVAGGDGGGPGWSRDSVQTNTLTPIRNSKFPQKGQAQCLPLFISCVSCVRFTECRLPGMCRTRLVRG